MRTPQDRRLEVYDTRTSTPAGWIFALIMVALTSLAAAALFTLLQP